MARPKPLADLVAPCLGRAVAAQGFSGADVIVSWPEIVGERLAAVSQPIRIAWARRPDGADRRTTPEPAALHVRVEGAWALELQHLAPLLIERVNGFYGWRCVGRVVLKQGPVRRASAREERVPEPNAEDRRHVAEQVAGVAEDGLREALARLGAAARAASRRPAPEDGLTPLPQSSGQHSGLAKAYGERE